MRVCNYEEEGATVKMNLITNFIRTPSWLCTPVLYEGTLCTLLFLLGVVCKSCALIFVQHGKIIIIFKQVFRYVNYFMNIFSLKPALSMYCTF